MIGFLQGILIMKKPPFLMINVSGVGYELQASMNTFYNLPSVGATVSLYTHLVVREDAQLLYGFHSEQEKAIFMGIIKVSGVGPKLALSILSGMNVNELLLCIKSRDVVRLVKIPGVGKKTAERLVIEMQGKFDKHIITDPSIKYSSKADKMNLTGIVQDAIDALIALGYKHQEANSAVMDFVNDAEDSESLIRLALKNLGKA